MKNTILWIGALVVGAIMGLLGISWLNEVMNFVATVYMRLFQLLAVPTIVLAVITTFATFGFIDHFIHYIFSVLVHIRC